MIEHVEVKEREPIVAPPPNNGAPPAEASAAAIIPTSSLPALINRAAKTLEGATTAAEVLEARDMAAAAYDIAKLHGRLAKAKEAHDTLIDAIHHAQADALIIETQAKARLAEEYDAAQARGEVQGHGGDHTSKIPNENVAPTVDAVGLTSKEVHDARQMRDAEKADLGVIKRALDEKVARGEEPTRAAAKRAATAAKNKDKAAPAEKTKMSSSASHAEARDTETMKMADKLIEAERQAIRAIINKAELHVEDNGDVNARFKEDDWDRLQKRIGGAS